MINQSNKPPARGEKERAVYASATALGEQLETVSAKRPPALLFEAAARVHAVPEVQSLTSSLFERRRDGSAFISDEEWGRLCASRPFWSDAAPLIEQCYDLRQRWRFGRPAQESRIILFDARVLQSTTPNGTRSHALAILLAFLEAVPSSHEIAFLTSDQLPALAREIAGRASVDWRPGLIGDVDVFVQLATISSAMDPVNVDLLRVPWIHRISVFLDDIQGLYPAHFTGTEQLFWLHQLAIEKLRSSHVILTLGETSLREARALWSSLMPNEAQPTFLITSCLTSIPGVEGEPTTRSQGEVLVFGNYHPHKNLALVACAVGSGRAILSSAPRFTFLADLSVSQKRGILNVATQAAGESQTDGISFVSALSGSSLARRIRDARAVIIPSLHEGFSIPVIEAVSLGTPVLLSRIDAHRELLPEGPWFFDPTDVTSLLNALVACETDGLDWTSAQREGLARNYDPGTLPRAVATALDVFDLRKDLRLREAPAVEHVGPNLMSDAGPPSTINALHLAQRDREFMSMKLGVLDMNNPANSALHKPRVLFKSEHDNIVAEFHASFTWRAGRAVTAPLRWIQSLRARRRA